MLRNTVKVGGIAYAIEPTEGPIIVNRHECRGSCDYETCTLKVLSTCGRGRQHETLWHEVIHALAYDNGLDQSDEGEFTHETLDRIAVGMHRLMVDNGVDFWEVAEQ